MQTSLPVPLKFWKPCINFRVYNFFSVDFALKVVKWSDTQTIKLQLWDIAGNKPILKPKPGDQKMAF